MTSNFTTEADGGAASWCSDGGTEVAISVLDTGEEWPTRHDSARSGGLRSMGRYSYTIHVEAPPELVFELWTDLELMKEWIGGVNRVSEPSGPIDAVGTRYTVYFGGIGSPTEVIDADRPKRYVTKFGTTWLRGTNSAAFEPDGTGTRLIQTFVTEGFLPGIVGWIFGHGSYRGSFLGELRHFGRIAEAMAKRRETVEAS